MSNVVIIFAKPLISLRHNIFIFCAFNGIIKRSFFTRGDASQAFEKLAFIPRVWYSIQDLSGVEKPLYKNLINNIFSQKAGEKRFNLSKTTLPSLFKRAVASTVLASTMFVGTAYAADAPHNNAPVQNASVATNPYIGACDKITEKTYKAQHEEACRDAANGTVVILRNPKDVIDPVRDGFLSSVKRAYGNSIPVEFRDTQGATTIFMFDKNINVDSDMLVNGSLLYVLGKKYPEKIAVLAEFAPHSFN